MRTVRSMLSLGVVLALAGCGVASEGAVPPSHQAADVAEPTKTAKTSPPAVSEPTIIPAEEVLVAMDYGEAYDFLYTAIEPSDLLIDEWNVASDAEDWAAVRSLSGRLAESLRELQTTVLAADWPAEAQESANTFAEALGAEVDWYSVVAIAAGDAATIAALEQAWTNDAVTASDELWSVLEAGMAGTD